MSNKIEQLERRKPRLKVSRSFMIEYCWS